MRYEYKPGDDVLIISRSMALATKVTRVTKTLIVVEYNRKTSMRGDNFKIRHSFRQSDIGLNGQVMERKGDRSDVYDKVTMFRASDPLGQRLFQARRIRNSLAELALKVNTCMSNGEFAALIESFKSVSKAFYVSDRMIRDWIKAQEGVK